MANRHFPNSERSVPGLNFILPVRFRFNISASPSSQQVIKEYCKKNKISFSELARKILLKKYKIKNINNFEGELEKNYDLFFEGYNKIQDFFLNSGNLSRELVETILMEIDK